MHRPLRVPLHLRVWNLIKGILFYNTVYWQKASDGLNMPTLSREEREKARPAPDPEIIKPRDKPRSKLDAFRGAEISNPVYEAQVSDPVHSMSEAAGGEGTEAAAGGRSPDGQYVKRRKYKRRRTSGRAGGNGFFRRVFGK